MNHLGFVMLRMIQSKSANQAKDYFNEALLKSDYYLDSQELPGHFHGKLAKRIGIEGAASKEVFYALCENQHPFTGDSLTPRTVSNRTNGYDVNFHCPKSVSYRNFTDEGDGIWTVFQHSVQEIMQHIETDSKTRVRKNGMDEDRVTGELLWCDFPHLCARPVKGFAPDMHLHNHSYVFNATWDETEQQIKAGQFRDIKADMPYYQALFYKDLSDRLIGLGYGIRATAKSFEIDDVPQEAINLFSKRTDEIGRIAEQNNITNAVELGQIGARSRAKKQKSVTMAELKKEWRRQLAESGINELDLNLTTGKYKDTKRHHLTVQDCINYALLHHFERSSVVRDRRLLSTALHAAIGSPITKEDVIKEFERDKRILRNEDNGKVFCTTQEALAEERRMIELATARNIKPLYEALPKNSLMDDHAIAAAHILTKDKAVSIIAGRAGTGKTTMMKETVRMIEATGISPTIIAPTSQVARNVLRDEGFTQAETLAALLTDERLQQQLQGQALIIDEAGQVGIKDMTAILELAAQYDAQVILMGDDKQHSSVAYGDALRVLRDVGNVPSVSLSTIYRQKNEQYRQAVYDLSNGMVEEGFKKLDGLQAIIEVPADNPFQQLVGNYINALNRRRSALVVCPTHRQGKEVTQAIRAALRAQGRIKGDDHRIIKAVNLNLTEAEKTNACHYQPGYMVQFKQSGPGVQRGSRWTVSEVGKSNLILQNDEGKKAELPLIKAAAWDVFELQDMPLAKQDSVRITRNNFDSDRKRLNNGQVFDVLSISENHITLYNKATKTRHKVPKDFAHLTHSYCSTSHGSQGKTVDEIFIAQPASTFPATDLKQFYVSVSRGREKVYIYTDDKEGLFECAGNLNNRRSALELLMRGNMNLSNPVRKLESSYNAKVNNSATVTTGSGHYHA